MSGGWRGRHDGISASAGSAAGRARTERRRTVGDFPLPQRLRRCDPTRAGTGKVGVMTMHQERPYERIAAQLKDSEKWGETSFEDVLRVAKMSRTVNCNSKCTWRFREVPD